MRRGAILAVGGAAALAVAGMVAALSPPRDDSPGRPSPPAAESPDGGPVGDPAHGEAVFRVCSACHTVGRGGADVDGPNLYGVVGARVAERRPRYGYTQALRDVGGIWTEARLRAWLADPAAVAPGTAMRFPGLTDARDRTDVIAYLSRQGPVRK